MNRQLITDLAWGVSIAVVALVASFARKLGYVDGDTVTRLVIGLIGLMVMSFGNRLSGMAVTIGCCISLRAKARAA